MDLQRQAHALLTKAHEEGRIRFIGNLEAREALSPGDADVLVTDGFTGNIFLKAMEGMALTFSQTLKSMILSGTKTKFAGMLLKDGIREMKKRFDSAEVGGTALLGITKPVIKAHGSSDGRAFFSAIRQAAEEEP
jgi:glycerol-3-phosphate acyltransferase PlsX